MIPLTSKKTKNGVALQPFPIIGGGNTSPDSSTVNDDINRIGGGGSDKNNQTFVIREEDPKDAQDTFRNPSGGDNEVNSAKNARKNSFYSSF